MDVDANVGGGMVVDGEMPNPAFNRMPAEMWVEIFSYNTEIQRGSRELINYRQVCTTWRYVTDGFMKYPVVVVNDKNFHPRLMFGLPASEVVINSLIRRLAKNTPLFRLNTMSTLKVWGPVSSGNFESVISRQSDRLKKLYFSQEALAARKFIMPAARGNERRICLPALELLNVHARLDSSLLQSKKILTDNMTEIFNFRMDNLKTIALNFTYLPDQTQESRNHDSELYVSFIGRHRNLDKLIIDVDSFLHEGPPSHMIPLDPVILDDHILSTRLTFIRISVHLTQLKTWMILLNLQNSLKRVSVNIADSAIKDIPQIRHAETYLLQLLGQMLAENGKSLESIQFTNFCVEGELVSARLFASMRRLRCLRLELIPRPGITRFPEWNMLPESLNVLKLKGFLIENQDLPQVGRRMNGGSFEYDGKQVVVNEA